MDQHKNVVIDVKNEDLPEWAQSKVAFPLAGTQWEIIGEDEEDTKTGYCWMHKINCLKENWCNTWVAGGPIEEDEESYEKQ